MISGLSLPKPPTPATSCCRYVFQSSMCMTLSFSMRCETRNEWWVGGVSGRAARSGTLGPAPSPAASHRAGLLRSDHLRFDAQRLRDAGAVGRIRLGAIGNVPLLDVQPGVAHRPRRVLEQHLLLRRRHLPEQAAGLLPIVIVDTVVPMRRIALDRHRRLGEIGLVIPKPCAVGVESERSAQIAVSAHCAVAVIALERAYGRVDRDMIEVDAEPVALRIAIGEQPMPGTMLAGEKAACSTSAK